MIAEAEREEYDAAAFFERMLYLHVEQPLNVQVRIPVIVNAPFGAS